ncbi:hypothetical protein PYW07_000683 [Mythimna separata]|uniref:OPA3-like protein n=1 Tax=Mythimna separata TaxID=271217 RepID=A0AAD7YT27_MYTSE|nr:hypothetical protein PYW07_000683 [Mythimna separata]
MAPAGHFPLFRLGTLLARQLSKPIADRIKQFALDHPWFRRAVCARTGRAFHTVQLRLRLWTLALRQPRALPPLSEQAALSAGADILGEIAVFGLGGLIVVYEVNRQADKQEDKVLEEESRRVAVLLSLEELRRELALQQRDLDRLQAALRRLAPPRRAAPPPAPTPPSPERSTPPMSSSPTTPTSERSTSPASASPISPKSEHCTPPLSDSSTPPPPDSTTPPTTEYPPPPVSVRE